MGRLELLLIEILAALRVILSGKIENPSKPFTQPVRPGPDDMPLAPSGGSGFKFSSRSMGNLAGVKSGLQQVMAKALSLSAVDFAIVEGIRSEDRQRDLVEAGASQTMNSKHLTGDAVDVAAYVGGKIDWTAVHYLCIATAVCYAAKKAGVGIRWGGAWHINDIRVCADKEDPGRTMMELYKQLRRSQGRKVFLDLGHFELSS